jgi:hypothetical protein
VVVEKTIRIPERFFDNHYRRIFEMASKGKIGILSKERVNEVPEGLGCPDLYLELTESKGGLKHRLTE